MRNSDLIDADRDTYRFHRFRRWWRQYIKPCMDEWEWLVIWVLAVLALLLGVIGFGRYSHELGRAWSGWDVFYLSLQLFTMESGMVAQGDRVPAALTVARFLAPGVAIYTVSKAFVALFYHQLQLMWVRLFVRDHVIVCGLGANGYLIATRCYQSGMPVVAIEQNDEAGRASQARGAGIIVLAGNGRDPHMLKRAGIRRARYVAAVSGDDGVNAEIAMRVRETLAGVESSHHVTCILHILDSRLCQLLAEREVDRPPGDPLRLHFFSVYDRGARVMLQEHPPPGFCAEDLPAAAPHVLIVGLGKLGRALVVEAAKSWHQQHGSDGPRLTISMADREADAITRELVQRYPAIKQSTDLRPWVVDLTSTDFEDLSFILNTRDTPDRPPLAAVYCCLADDSQSLATALAVNQRLHERLGAGADSVRIVVRTLYRSGLGTLVRADDEATRGLEAFALFDRVCRPGLLFGGINEVVARALHDDWLRQQDHDGADKPTDRSWDELDDTQKEANRLRADAVERQLNGIHCDLRPRTDWAAGAYALREEEIETLARLEHKRWCQAKRSTGWQHGSSRDDDRLIHPDLVEWDQLGDGSRDYLRNSCRRLPQILASVGFDIYHLSDEASHALRKERSDT